MRTRAKQRKHKRSKTLKIKSRQQTPFYTKKELRLQKLNCSPKPKGEINKFSCYTNKSLYRLRDLWNARHPDVKITSSSPKEIHSFISDKLSGICNKESCWLK